MLALDIPPHATVAELRSVLIEDYPRLNSLASMSRWAVDGEFVDEFQRLGDCKQIAMIPPVSGG